MTVAVWTFLPGRASRFLAPLVPIFIAPADDPEGQARLAAFLQQLQEAGWAVGRNLRVDIRWRAVDADQRSKYAAELVALAPDVILATANDNITALRQANSAVPIVFAAVTDPVAVGLVASLARPVSREFWEPKAVS
jgi:putative ABC transport system substrate-binding protein